MINSPGQNMYWFAEINRIGNMKGVFVVRRWLILIVSLLLFSLISFPAVGNSPSILVDGKKLNFTVAPRIEQGTTLVPLRDIFEALGAQVHWDQTKQQITAKKGTEVIVLNINSTTALRNGVPIQLAVSAMIVDGSTLVPLRFIGESLGAIVNWDPRSRTVSVLSDQSPSQVNVNTLERQFNWNYGGKLWTYTLQIPKEAYDYYVGLKRPPTDDYSIYVTDPVDDYFIKALAARFLELAKQEGYSNRQTLELVISFVQSFKYVLDQESKGQDQYARYPLETLVEQKGDCEDTSILLASILKEMNQGAVLVMLPGEPGHMAVGIKGDNLPGTYYDYQGEKYYYVETTGIGWSIGQIPDEYKNRKAQILSLVPRPVISHSWEYTYNYLGDMVVKVTVKNFGTAAAKGTKIYASLDAGKGLVYDQSWSKALDLQPGSVGTYKLHLKVPPDVYTRLNVKVVTDGQVMAESNSERFKY